jgi:DNA-binding response OmpR family regulator
VESDARRPRSGVTDDILINCSPRGWYKQIERVRSDGSHAVRILLVEDQLQMARMLRQGFEEEGFAVDTATDGEEADVKARTTPYDVILLDVMLPKVDGLTLLKRWREAGITTHILMLTAKGDTPDKVYGLDSGADDYLSKANLSFDELLARVRALVRRGHQKKDPVIRVHDLTLDTAARSVTRGAKKIPLTPREYALLEFLAFHAGSVVTRTMIWDHLYDEYDENTSNVVDVYIRYLRNKVDKGHEVPLILTKWGEGYMLRGNDDAPEPATAAAKPDKLKRK